MAKQVPEEAADTAKLLTKVLGSNIFQENRGKYSNLEAFILEMLTDKKSPFYSPTPSQAEIKIKELMTGLRPIMRRLSQLNRDGHDGLVKGAVKALVNKEYIMSGETKKEKLVPMTIFMVEPEKSSLLLDSRLSNLDAYDFLRQVGIKKPYKDWAPHQNTLDILKAFPSLSDILKKNVDKEGDNFGSALRLAYYKDVVKPNSHIFYSLPKYYVSNCGNGDRDTDEGGGFNFVEYRSNHFEKFCKRNGFNLSEKDLEHSRGIFYLVLDRPDKVLKNVSRNDQKKISTWTMYIPSSLIKIDSCYEGLKSFHFGVHKESEHTEEAGKRPMFVSKSTSNGYGMIGIPPTLDNSGSKRLYEKLLRNYDWGYYKDRKKIGILINFR